MAVRIRPTASVTQATSKSTAVTCDALGGAITMNNASLAASTSVNFTVNNVLVSATDVPNVAIASGGTAGSYVIIADAVAAGSFRVHIRNVTAGALGEALVINFAILKV